MGQSLLDDFVIERELGAGGMGKVFLVRSQSGGQRFAVKKTHTLDAESRRQFLAELQTWIDLPDHPHLAACRFFRTIGDAVVIFAEYVDGGSLADWIADGRITDIRRLLDIVIQFAWGLQAAHERGLVHQDIKPANVLMTKEGVVKVADFGLARTRVRGGIAGEDGASGLVSFGGRTLAYCSPEQAAGQRLGPGTDVWSWGLSVLEIFTGGVTWMSGVAAAEVFEAYLEEGPPSPEAIRMPPALAYLLRRCFLLEPRERPSMEMLAGAIQQVYQKEAGEEYTRASPGGSVERGLHAVVHDRWSLDRCEWRDPREWLLEAFEAAGRSAAEIETYLPQPASSRKAQAIAELPAYEEARRILVQLIADGNTALRKRLVALCMEKALIHSRVDDFPGALKLKEQAIEVCECLVHQEGHCELTDALAGLYEANRSEPKLPRHPHCSNEKRCLTIWSQNRMTVGKESRQRA